MGAQVAVRLDPERLAVVTRAWARFLSEEAFGEAGPGLELRLDGVDDFAAACGDVLARAIAEELLGRQSERLPEEVACPECGTVCPVKTKPRPLMLRRGEFPYEEPCCHCPRCRADFFPPPAAARHRRAEVQPGGA